MLQPVSQEPSMMVKERKVLGCQLRVQFKLPIQLTIDNKMLKITHITMSPITLQLAIQNTGKLKGKKGKKIIMKKWTLQLAMTNYRKTEGKQEKNKGEKMKSQWRIR